MTRATTKADSSLLQNETEGYLFDNWNDPLETEIRGRIRGFIEELIHEELDAVLARPRYGRHTKNSKDSADIAVGAGAAGHRHGSRPRTLMGTFGKIEINVPRARLQGSDGKTSEWKSSALRAYQRRTVAADALIASTYLAGTNTRRVRRALATLFGGAVSKDTVSRVWRKVKNDWEAWNARSLATEPIVRLILDGTVVRVRLDRKARRCCSRSRAWVGRAARPGARFSTISSSAACGGLSSFSSMAHPGSTRRSLPCGKACRCSDARCTSTGTCSLMRPNDCTKRSPTIITI